MGGWEMASGLEQGYGWMGVGPGRVDKMGLGLEKLDMRGEAHGRGKRGRGAERGSMGWQHG